jgi:hypothetical protein
MENCGQGERRRGEISFLATLDIRHGRLVLRNFAFTYNNDSKIVY